MLNFGEGGVKCQRNIKDSQVSTLPRNLRAKTPEKWWLEGCFPLEMIHLFSGLVNFLFFLAWHKVSKLFPLRCLPSSWCVWKNAHDWRCAVACDAEWMERWKVNLESSLWRIGTEWYHKSGLSGYCWRCCRIWFHDSKNWSLLIFLGYFKVFDLSVAQMKVVDRFSGPASWSEDLSCDPTDPGSRNTKDCEHPWTCGWCGIYASHGNPWRSRYVTVDRGRASSFEEWSFCNV